MISVTTVSSSVSTTLNPPAEPRVPVAREISSLTVSNLVILSFTSALIWKVVVPCGRLIPISVSLYTKPVAVEFAAGSFSS